MYTNTKANRKLRIKNKLKDLEQGFSGTVLGMGTKIGALSKLQVRNKIKELRVMNKN